MLGSCGSVTTPGPAWIPALPGAHQRLWTDLTRRAQPGYAAAPAALLAFTAWQGGNGALANIALDRALADTPGLLHGAAAARHPHAGIPPSAAVVPMTPEQVAESYAQRATHSPATDQPGRGPPAGHQHAADLPPATGISGPARTRCLPSASKGLLP